MNTYCMLGSSVVLGQKPLHAKVNMSYSDNDSEHDKSVEDDEGDDLRGYDEDNLRHSRSRSHSRSHRRSHSRSHSRSHRRSHSRNHRRIRSRSRGHSHRRSHNRSHSRRRSHRRSCSPSRDRSDGINSSSSSSSSNQITRHADDMVRHSPRRKRNSGSSDRFLASNRDSDSDDRFMVRESDHKCMTLNRSGTTITTRTRTMIQRRRPQDPRRPSMMITCLNMNPFWNKVFNIGSDYQRTRNKEEYVQFMCVIILCITYAGQFSCCVSESEWSRNKKSNWYISGLDYFHKDKKLCSVINYKTILLMLQLYPHQPSMWTWSKHMLNSFVGVINNSTGGDRKVFRIGNDTSKSPYKQNVSDFVYTCDLQILQEVLRNNFFNTKAVQQTYEDNLPDFNKAMLSMTWAVRDTLNGHKDTFTDQYLEYRTDSRGDPNNESVAFGEVCEQLAKLGVKNRAQAGSWKVGAGRQYNRSPLTTVIRC